METYNTDNKKLFSPVYIEKNIEEAKIKKFTSLFKNINYFELSPLISNTQYRIYDEDECAKWYGYLKSKKSYDVYHTFINKKELQNQQEKANLHFSDNDFDVKNLPKTEDCVERYLPYKLHYKKLKELKEEFDFSYTNTIMLFGVSRNFKVVREGTFRCVSDNEIDEYRIIDNKLKLSDKYLKITKGFIYHYVIRKLHRQENFNWERVINLLNEDKFTKKICYSSRQFLKSTKSFVEIYNENLDEDNKITNPYDKKKRFVFMKK